MTARNDPGIVSLTGEARAPQPGEDSMSPVMNSAMEGLTRNAAGVERVARNVANVNTDGYRAEPHHGSSEARDSADSQHEPAPSDVDLAGEFVHLKQYEAGYRANATLVRVADRMLGELLDLLG